jgi:copper chaperone NosL
MLRSTRVMIAVAALMLGLLYVLPLWRIQLHAPQYPEGLGLRIWVNQITGQQPQDLNSINGLNHYIGMKAIQPDDIPELRFMPVLVGGLIATGLLVAALGRRGPLYAWVGLFACGALVGLGDFWRWGYDYGHNLDPRAIIKVPGMSYQPPLVGSKQLLNFTATSWPGAGGWIAVAALLLGVTAVVLELRHRKREQVDRAVVVGAAHHPAASA